MHGRNPLFVAQQHSDCVLTMLTVYAAWTEGSLEPDVSARSAGRRAHPPAGIGMTRRPVRSWQSRAPFSTAKDPTRLAAGRNRFGAAGSEFGSQFANG